MRDFWSIVLFVVICTAGISLLTWGSGSNTVGVFGAAFVTMVVSTALALWIHWHVNQYGGRR